MDRTGDHDAPDTERPTRRQPGRKQRRRRDERGATLVEYALLVALIAIPTIASINMLHDASQAKIDDTAVRISTRPAPVVGG